MVKTQEVTKPNVKLTRAQSARVALYRKRKQLEKRIKDRLDADKTLIASFSEGAFNGIDGGKKVVSVSWETRGTLDREALFAAHPELEAILERFTRDGETYPVVRLH